MDDCIDDLVWYALVKRISPIGTGGTKISSLWIHPLVQHYARESYCDNGSVTLAHDEELLDTLRRKGARDAVRLVGYGLNSRFSNRESKEWIYERQNMAHLSLCCDEYIPKHIAKQGDIRDKLLALALNNFGVFKHYWHDIRTSETLFLESIRLYESVLPASTETEVALLNTKKCLVSIYISRDRLNATVKNVELLMSEVLLGHRLLLGEHHPDTLDSASVQAMMVAVYGNLVEAVELYQMCMENNQMLDPGNPTNMATTRNLAFAYARLGKNSEAMELLNLSLVLHRKYRGANHQDTLVALGGIARFKARQGQLQEAFECYRDRAEGFEQTFGLANRDTLDALAEARMFCLRKRYFEEAMRMTKRYLEGWKALIGKEHVDAHRLLQDIEAERAKYLVGAKKQSEV